MNKNQIKTLALYAINYSYKEISQTLNISVNTVKWRLKTVRIKYPEYWDNAYSIRMSHKRNKIKLDNTIIFSTLIGYGPEKKAKLGLLATHKIKRVTPSDTINIGLLLQMVEKMEI